MGPSELSVARKRIEYLEGEIESLKRRLDATRAGQRALHALDKWPRRAPGRPNKQTAQLADVLVTLARDIEANQLANDAEIVTELEYSGFPRELIDLAVMRMIKKMEGLVLDIARQAVDDWTRKSTNTGDQP